MISFKTNKSQSINSLSAHLNYPSGCILEEEFIVWPPNAKYIGRELNTGMNQSFDTPTLYRIERQPSNREPSLVGGD